MNPTVNDIEAENLAKAIRQRESGGNFNAVGDAGTSKGGYQFQEGTWKQYAKEILGDENSEMTPQNQNAVAYGKIKTWKDGGKNAAQIAAMWNAGENIGDKWVDHKGKTNINGKVLSYDTPQYVKDVTDLYQQFKGQSPQPSTKLPEPQPKKEDTLGTELLDRTQQGTTAVKESLSGKQNVFSGLLQAGGAVAGAVGDVATKGLELIPSVKQVEGLIGKGVGKLADTETGQKITGAISKFSQEHPEASKNIGAVVNIASAIPILKGVGLAKNLVMDAASIALKKQAEKIALKEFNEVISKTIGGRNALTKNPEAIKTIIAERALPEIVNNKYSVKEAYKKLGERISEIEDTKLQPELAKANTAGVQTSYIPLKQVEKEAMKIAEDELKDTGPVKKYFELLNKKYGETPTLQDLNEAKRKVSKNITEAGFNSPSYSTDKIVRSSLQKAVEDGARALGLKDVEAINQEMAQLIKAQNLLKYLEGKPIKTGTVGGILKSGATIGGEMAGNATGIPFAGALTGRRLGGYAGKKLSSAGVTEGILKRTGKNAQRVSREELKGKLKGLFGGIVAQRTTKED